MKNPYLKEEYVTQAKALLAKMTLEEKIGQLNLQDFYHGEEDDKAIRSGKLGNIFFICGVEQTNKLQKMAVEETRLGIPMLMGYDIIHGMKSVFPIPLGTAASWDLKRIEEAERMAAVESYVNGINWIYAPMVDLCREPRWGRIAEGAGEDPYLGGCIAAARVRGLQTINPETGYPYVAACFKHFAGYGLAEGGRDYDTTDISERTLYGEYMKPYQAAIEAGALSTMSSFNCLNGDPVSGSYHYLTEILREKFGFEGMVASDYNAIMELKNHRTAESDRDAAYIGITAGNDMDMTSHVYWRELPGIVKDHPEVEEKINESVIRVLTLKYALGLFAHPYHEKAPAEELTMCQEHIERARDMARHSMVLLKNDNHTLPLKKGKKYLVVGPLSDTPRDNLGTWDGCGNENDAVSPLAALKKVDGITVSYCRGCDYEEYNEEGFPEALEMAKNCDEVIFCGGETKDWSGENHNKTHPIVPQIQIALLEKLKEMGKTVIFLLMTGRPLACPRIHELSDAVLCTWHSGIQAGNAICDILFGDFAPCGKLTSTWPYYIGQIPTYYCYLSTGRPRDQFNRYIDSKPDPLYPFGYGLSYGEITYTDTAIQNPELKKGETLHATVTVCNDSDTPTHEVVEVYYQDMVSKFATAVRRLCAFDKVFVGAHSKVEVSFEIPYSRFAYMTPQLEEVVEPGDFRLYIGRDSSEQSYLPFRVID